MQSTTTLILGGGFGGIAAAHTLRSLLPDEHRIVLIDRSPHFAVGATKTWIILGEKEPDDVTSNRENLLPENVEFIQADIQKINIKNGVVFTSQGEVNGDYFIIALGADVNMGAIPGLDRAAHSFYTMDDAVELQKVLHDFKKGEIVLLIPRMPIKCPPAPYEAALMLDDYFKRHKLRQQINLSIYTVEPGPMATAGPEMSTYIRSLIESRNIEYHPLKKTESIDDKSRRIVFNDGSEKNYDLLIAIPPHQAPKVIRDAELINAGGWIPVDPKTMKVNTGEGTIPVYAVGDNTVVPLLGRHKPDVPLVLPKAGVFAASHGTIAAQQIAADVRGESIAGEFDGKGYCYIEVGGAEAIKGEGSFFEMPHPQMKRKAPDKEQYQDKVKWIENWSSGKVV